MRVVVLGGGVIGVTTAYYLGCQGVQVVVVECGDTLAGERTARRSSVGRQMATSS